MESNSKKPIVIACVCALLFFILALFTYRNRTAAKEESLFHTAAAPVQETVNEITRIVSDFMQRVFFPSSIQQENEELKRKIAVYERDLVLYEETAKENARLSELLDFVQENSSMRYLTASVTAKNINTASASLTLNVGTRHGVTEKTPVITGTGVVGRVTEVGNSWCKVHTVMNDEMRLSVLVERTRDEGTLGGLIRVNGEVTGMKLYYLPENADLRVGDRIVTSSSGGVFPKGLFIGTVTAINDEENASYAASVSSEIDFDHLENVLLVLDMDKSGYD